MHTEICQSGIEQWHTYFGNANSNAAPSEWNQYYQSTKNSKINEDLGEENKKKKKKEQEVLHGFEKKEVTKYEQKKELCLWSGLYKILLQYFLAVVKLSIFHKGGHICGQSLEPFIVFTDSQLYNLWHIVQ